MVISFMEDPECENFRLKARTNQLNLSVRYCFFARKFLFRSENVALSSFRKGRKNARSLCGKAQVDQKSFAFFQVSEKEENRSKILVGM